MLRFFFNFGYFFLFLILIGIVNTITIKGLKRGKETRSTLLTGLINMYQDQNVAQYYDEKLLKGYDMRYTLFTIVVVATGVIALAVPLVLLLVD